MDKLLSDCTFFLRHSCSSGSLSFAIGNISTVVEPHLISSFQDSRIVELSGQYISQSLGSIRHASFPYWGYLDTKQCYCIIKEGI